MDRSVINAGATLSLVLIAAGCGSVSKPLSPTAFVRQANEICRRVNTQVERQNVVMMTAFKHHDRAAGVQATNKAVEVEEAGLAELDRLVPPMSLKDRYARYVTVEREARRMRLERERLFVEHKTPAMEFLQRRYKLVHEGLAMREALGLTDCNRY